MKLRASFLFMVFIGVGILPATAQNASVALTVTDSSDYQLYFGGERICDNCDSKVQLDSLAAGSHLLDIITQGSTSLHFRVELFLDSSGMAEFQLSPDSITHYRFEQLNAPAVVDYTLPAGQAAENFNVEVTQLGSSVRCAPPISPSAHERNLEQLSHAIFERDKVKILERILGQSCLSTQQIRELVEYVEDDERRLELLVKAHTQCFDLAEFHSLVDLLYLSRNQTRFSMLFGD